MQKIKSPDSNRKTLLKLNKIISASSYASKAILEIKFQNLLKEYLKQEQEAC